MERAELGRMGETIAAAYLERRGWTIVARNVRRREGEIDVIAQRDGVVAFVEVKTRRSTAFGPPAEAVTRTKARRIRALAARYLAEHSTSARQIRFDVIDILGSGDVFRVRHLEGAF